MCLVCPYRSSYEPLVEEKEEIVVLGHGSFGTVELCKWGSFVCARKTMLKADPSAQRDFVNESRLLSNISHPNITRVFWTEFETTTLKSIYMEYGGMSVIDYMNGTYTHAIAFDDLRGQIIDDLVNAVTYLHSVCIYHCDIKLDNMVLDVHGTTKLIDFGLAIQCKGPDVELFGARGSGSYCAPEVFTGSYYGIHADAWSVGVVAFGLYMKFFPFIRANNSDWRFKKIFEFQESNEGHTGTFAKIASFYPDRMSVVPERFEGLLAIDPKKRAKVADVA